MEVVEDVDGLREPVLNVVADPFCSVRDEHQLLWLVSPWTQGGFKAGQEFMATTQASTVDTFHNPVALLLAHRFHGAAGENTPQLHFLPASLGQDHAAVHRGVHHLAFRQRRMLDRLFLLVLQGFPQGIGHPKHLRGGHLDAQEHPQQVIRLAVNIADPRPRHQVLQVGADEEAVGLGLEDMVIRYGNPPETALAILFFAAIQVVPQGYPPGPPDPVRSRVRQIPSHNHKNWSARHSGVAGHRNGLRREQGIRLWSWGWFRSVNSGCC